MASQHDASRTISGWVEQSKSGQNNKRRGPNTTRGASSGPNFK